MKLAAAPSSTLLRKNSGRFSSARDFLPASRIPALVGNRKFLAVSTPRKKLPRHKFEEIIPIWASRGAKPNAVLPEPALWGRMATGASTTWEGALLENRRRQVD